MPTFDQQASDGAVLLSSHSQIRAMLPAYVSDLVLRSSGLAEHRALIAHLRSCAACRQEVYELSELLRATAAGELPQVPPGLSRPRLDFLRSSPGRPWERDDSGRLTVRFTAALLEQIRMAPLAGAVRATERAMATTPLYQYDQAQHEDPQPHTPMTISIFGLGTDPATVDLVVRVGVAGRGVDLSGSEVILTSGQLERHEHTDRFGYVYFKALPAESLPNIQVAILPRA
jgi:hypothetical protein